MKTFDRFLASVGLKRLRCARPRGVKSSTPGPFQESPYISLGHEPLGLAHFVFIPVPPLNSEKLFDYFRSKSVTDDLCRDAADHSVIGNILDDDGPCPNQRAVADLDTVSYKNPGPDPYVVADGRRLYFVEIVLIDQSGSTLVP